MKPTILKLSAMLLLFVTLGPGCQKDDPNYDPNSIIGEWEWLYSVSGDFSATYSYPKDGQTQTIEFKQDNNLILRENGDITLQTIFSTSEDTLSYQDNIEYFYTYKIDKDTLRLMNLFMLGNYRFYIKIK